MTRQRAYQIRNQQKGLCILCGKKAKTKNHCQRHAEETRARALRWHNERVATGLCVVCQKPRNKWKNECDPCREVRREYMRKWNENNG